MSAIFSAVLSALLISLWVVYSGRWIAHSITLSKDRLSFDNHTIAYAFTLIGTLLILVNINQITGSTPVFNVYLLCSVTLIPIIILKLDTQERVTAFKDALSLFSVQLCLILILMILFRVHQFWLLEGPNHDSLIYFEGMKWSLFNPLQVDKEAVRAAWGLGVCGEGSTFIGHDCPLYRGGSYSLIAWNQFFNPSKTANGAWLSGALMGAFTWISIRFVASIVSSSSNSHRKKLFFVTLLASISTGWLGTLTNSNIATTFASGAIVLMFSLTFARRFTHKPLLVGMLIGLSGHFYAEAIFYTGFLALLVLTKDALHDNASINEKIRSFFNDSLIVFLVFILAGNYTAYQAIHSLLFIAGISHGEQQWASWYIHSPVWYWIGSFVAGDLLGHHNISKPSVVYASIAAITIVLANARREFRIPAASLISLSTLLVLIIILMKYQYGEHKILQLVGPSWFLFIAAVVLDLALRSSTNSHGAATLPSTHSTAYLKKSAYILATILTMYVTIDYTYRSNQLLKGIRDQHNIKFGDQNIATHVSPGDIVAFDDSALSIGAKPFILSHYAAFFIHENLGRMVMPDITDYALRGGYYRNILNNTLRKTRSVDYLLQGIGAHEKHSVFKYEDHPSIRYPSYKLVDVRGSGVALMGNGWHRCEAAHCWTRNGFVIEVYNNAPASITLELEYYKPPADGRITVYVDNTAAQSFSPDDDRIEIGLKSGYHKVKIVSSWKETSPKEEGLSDDNRKLFAMVKEVRLI